jgi:hypothetical protein
LDAAKINNFTVFEFLDEVVVFDLLIMRQLRKAASDVKIDIKLSNIKPIHTFWIVAAFQQVK